MNKPERDFKYKFRLPVFLFLFLQSCSSTPRLIDRYRAVDSDRKIAYLAYYPDLTPEQRNELLSPDADSPRVLIESWRIDPSRPFDDFVKDPRHHTIRKLEIIDTLNHFQAIAHYDDGRKVDVTQDAVWKATPTQLEMRRNLLQYSCVNAEAVVSADFIGESSGSLHFQIEKPIEYLEIRVNDSYLASDKGFDYKLDAIAHCKDGTHADVSCQADWSSRSSIGEISGCGNFAVSERQKRDAEASFATVDDTFQVTARYAGVSQTRTLPAPKR